MSDYISREAAIKMLLDDKTPPGLPIITPTQKREFEIFDSACDRHAKMLSDLPAADVREVKRGKWKRTSYKSGYGYRCSECGATYNKRKSRLSFCPNCGADMREENNG